MPWLASTTRIAPSHACSERLTSYVKSTCPGVSIRLKRIGLPIGRGIVEPDGARLDGDPLLTLKVHGVQHLAGHVPRIDGVGYLQEPIGKGRLAVVDVRHDAEVADAFLGDHEAEVYRAPMLSAPEQA